MVEEEKRFLWGRGAGRGLIVGLLVGGNVSFFLMKPILWKQVVIALF